jgi:hypothetical protein
MSSPEELNAKRNRYGVQIQNGELYSVSPVDAGFHGRKRQPSCPLNKKLYVILAKIIISNFYNFRGNHFASDLSSASDL